MLSCELELFGILGLMFRLLKFPAHGNSAGTSSGRGFSLVVRTRVKGTQPGCDRAASSLGLDAGISSNIFPWLAKTSSKPGNAASSRAAREASAPASIKTNDALVDGSCR